MIKIKSGLKDFDKAVAFMERVFTLAYDCRSVEEIDANIDRYFKFYEENMKDYNFDNLSSEDTLLIYDLAYARFDRGEEYTTQYVRPDLDDLPDIREAVKMNPAKIASYLPWGATKDFMYAWCRPL